MRRLLLLVWLPACMDFATAKIANSVTLGTVPVLSGSVPEHGSVDVVTTTDLMLFFNQPMDEATLVVGSEPEVGWSVVQWSSDRTSVNLVAGAALTLATTYTLTIAGKSVDGIALVESSVSFTTVSVVGVLEALTLDTTTPQSGAMNVDSPLDIVLQFSRAIAPAALVVTLTPAVTLPAPVADADAKIITYAGVMLAADTEYNVQVSATSTQGVSLSGASSFVFHTRAPPDTTPPTVQYRSPAAMTGNPTNLASVGVTFSEAMDTSFLPQDAIVLAGPGLSAACSPMWVGDNQLVCQLPGGASLTLNESYTVTVQGTLRDLAMNPLGADYSFNFVADSAPDTQRPELLVWGLWPFASVLVEPDPNPWTNPPSEWPRGVAKNATLTLQFSEPIVNLAESLSFSFTDPNGQLITSNAVFELTSGVIASEYLITIPSFEGGDALFHPADGDDVVMTLSSNAQDASMNLIDDATKPRVLRWRYPKKDSASVIATHNAYMISSSIKAENSSMYIGYSVSDSSEYRGFVSFPLTMMPTGLSLVSVESAVLTLHERSIAPPDPPGSMTWVSLPYMPGGLEIAHFAADPDDFIFCGCSGSLQKTSLVHSSLVTGKVSYDRKFNGRDTADFRLRYNMSVPAQSTYNHFWGLDYMIQPVARPTLDVSWYFLGDPITPPP